MGHQSLLHAQAFRRAMVRQLFQACLTGLAFLAALYFSGACFAFLFIAITCSTAPAAVVALHACCWSLEHMVYILMAVAHCEPAHMPVPVLRPCRAAHALAGGSGGGSYA